LLLVASWSPWEVLKVDALKFNNVTDRPVLRASRLVISVEWPAVVLNKLLIETPVAVLMAVIRLLVFKLTWLMDAARPADVLNSCVVMAVLNVDKVV
jgi:hypothetical protein